MAYLSLHPGQEKWNGTLRTLETLLNYVLILVGMYIIVAGTYVCSSGPHFSPNANSSHNQTSVQSIVNSYKAQLVGSLFSCASNAL